MQNKKPISYVTLEFSDEDKRRITEWCIENIPKDSLYINPDKDSYCNGIVTDTLHMTLVYGLDDSKIGSEDILVIEKLLKFNTIELGDVKEFYQEGQAYKTLYLEVMDPQLYIQDLRNSILKFPHFDEYQTQRFIPHITLAFIKKESNQNFNFSLSSKISILKLNYLKKNQTK
jgi:hypothetical protein